MMRDIFDRSGTRPFASLLVNWGIGFVVVGCGTCLLSPIAVAQVTGQADGLPVPDVSLVDEAGIDLTTGSRTDTLIALAIGAADQPSLNSTIGYKPGGTPGGGYVTSVCVAGSFSACQSSYWSFTMGTSVQYAGNGANTLTDGSFYTTAGGEFHVYTTAGEDWYFAVVPGSTGTLTGAQAYLKQITKADGRQLQYGYLDGQPSGRNTYPQSVSVTSTDGYQINKIFTNRRFVNCPTNSADCSADYSLWPNVRAADVGNGYTRYSSSGLQVLDAKVTFLNSNDVERIVFPSGGYIEYDEVQSGCAPFVADYVGLTVSAGRVPAYCSRISEVRTSRGTWRYTYNQPAASGGSVPASGQFPWIVTSTDPAGNATQLVETASNKATVTDQNGRATTYTYKTTTFQTGSVYKSFNKAIAQVVYPEGNKVTYSYDARLNLTSITKTPKPNSGLPESVWSASYPAGCTVSNYRVCNKPDWIVDPNGARTDYSYDPAHGGVLTKTLPTDANGVRAVTRYSYQQRSARYMDQSGQTVPGLPIWKLAQVKECRTSASCAGSAEEKVTTFDYDDNLLIKGMAITADGTTRRTCYGHDAIGNRIWETQPKAGLAACN